MFRFLHASMKTSRPKPGWWVDTVSPCFSPPVTSSGYCRLLHAWLEQTSKLYTKLIQLPNADLNWERYKGCQSSQDIGEEPTTVAFAVPIRREGGAYFGACWQSIASILMCAWTTCNLWIARSCRVAVSAHSLRCGLLAFQTSCVEETLQHNGILFQLCQFPVPAAFGCDTRMECTQCMDEFKLVAKGVEAEARRDMLWQNDLAP